MAWLWQPEGIPSEYSTSTFISLSSGETYNGVLNVSFPADGDLVPGSQYIEVTAIGKLWACFSRSYLTFNR